MVANKMTIVCPCCQSTNSYYIVANELVDNELHTTYCCEECGCEFTNIYALVYLGGYANEVTYDRDNLTVNR
jgi:hypothetical protein